MHRGRTLHKRDPMKLAGIIIAWTFICSFPVLGQVHDVYRAGFKIVSTYDSGRLYKPNSAVSDKLHYRPIEIDLWYPAEINSTDTTALFLDLVHLLERRENIFDDTKKYTGLTDELLRYICANLNCPDYTALKKIRTQSYVNARTVTQRFPLIVYLASFNGMSYENYLLFELLAQNGFVVACVSSIGRYPGNMTMDSTNVFEQIKDAEFSIQHLAKSNFISHDIGLIGYSWGGLAAVIMAMNEHLNIKSVVSLDGSEQFVYGDEEENEKLSLIRNSDFFQPKAMLSSYLYLDRDIAVTDQPDSIYNMIDFISGDKCYLKIDNSTHEDFSSLVTFGKENQDRQRYHLILQLINNYLRDRFKNDHVFDQHIPDKEVTRQFLPAAVKASKAGDDEKIVKGIIYDKKTNLPLPYVNIGILNKDKGTTSNIKGEFQIPLSGSDIHDTLRISMVGYQPEIIILKDIIRDRKPYLTIQLQEDVKELKEIMITGKRFTTKVLGNRTASKFFGGKFASGDFGGEVAIKIKIRHVPTYLDAFRFNISYNQSDTGVFRVNIYTVKNGLPDKNILTDNVLLKLKGQTGKIEVDLSGYNIAVRDDFFISLEWISGRTNSGIVFSAGFANNGTYYRKASQGRWKKYPMGLGFNIVAKY